LHTLKRKAPTALNILALETSSQWCSVALWLDGRLLAREELAGQRHSELLLPMVDALLNDAALELRNMDAVAFGAGPGSFTGLRIACGVAQGLAAGAGIATVGVGTLMAMAQASGAPRVLACLDARMGEIYCAAYERNADAWHVVHPPRLSTPDEAPALDGGAWTGVGSGFEAYASALMRRYDGRIDTVQADLHPRAHEVAILGAEMFRQGLGPE
jgi:tRNA threonylcarbamoyladenosine biosynthesis protein TsaB